MSHGLARAKLVLDAAKTDAQTMTSAGHRLLTWNTPDTMVHFTESSDVFTCLVPGTYLFQWNILKSIGDGSSRRYYPEIYINGVLAYSNEGVEAPLGWAQFRPAIFVVPLAAGDTAAFYGYPSNATGSFTTYTGALGYNRIHGYYLGNVGPGVARRSPPSLVAATEAAAISTTQQKITYNTPSVNTAGFTESSDVFTCTIPGVYVVYIRTSLDATQYLRVQIYKNGAVVGSSNFCERIQSLLTFVPLAIGDTLSFYGYAASGCNLVVDSGSGIQVVLI